VPCVAIRSQALLTTGSRAPTSPRDNGTGDERLPLDRGAQRYLAFSSPADTTGHNSAVATPCPATSSSRSTPNNLTAPSEGSVAAWSVADAGSAPATRLWSGSSKQLTSNLQPSPVSDNPQPRPGADWLAHLKHREGGPTHGRHRLDLLPAPALRVSPRTSLNEVIVQTGHL
jgi:hypothetical protein